MHLFADDSVIFQEINNTYDTITLQADLDNIVDWCGKWLMKLNINKCELMRVSRSDYTPSPYHLNNVSLDFVMPYK